MEEETIRVCNWCNGEVDEVSFGDDGASVCSDCGATEAGSHEMTVSEWEELQDGGAA